MQQERWDANVNILRMFCSSSFKTVFTAFRKRILVFMGEPGECGNLVSDTLKTRLLE